MHGYDNQMKMVNGAKYFGCMEILLHYFITLVYTNPDYGIAYSSSTVVYRMASRGNTARSASLECCTLTASMSVINLPRSGGTLFTTLDDRTVDNTR